MSVLIVDDEIEILSMIERHLKLEGIDHQSFTSASEAIASHRKRFYPVILTDIRMPGMTGVEMIREIKKIHPTTIPFIMTGFANLNSLVECLEIGVVDYFHKPLEDLGLLVDSLKQALKRYQRWKKDLAGHLQSTTGKKS